MLLTSVLPVDNLKAQLRAATRHKHERREIMSLVCYEFTGRVDQDSHKVATIAADVMDTLNTTELDCDVVSEVVERLNASGDSEWDARAVWMTLDRCSFWDASDI